VGVHFANNSEDPFWVAQMMDTHPNLYADLAARVPELGRHEAKKLREVFVRHARRILFGTDTGVSSDGSLMLGSYGEEPNKREEVGPYFAGHWRWLETADTGIPSMTPIQGRWTLNGLSLPDEVLDRIYRENAVELFGPAPAREKKPAATSSP
jgi:predicted TIM-barrel fold metal-dependent hydrolase